MAAAASDLLTLSPKGQLTLPARMRKQLGLSAGSPVLARIVNGELVLSPAVVLPVEAYAADREAEFAAAAELAPDDVAAIRRRWGP